MPHSFEQYGALFYIMKTKEFIVGYEESVPVQGFEQFYELSKSGAIRSLKRNKVLKPALKDTGYLRVTLSGNGKFERKSIQRLVAEHFLPNPYNLPEVNHKDGNKLNNHVDNLEWCTSQENITHRFNVIEGEWRENQIQEVVDLMGKGLSVDEVAGITGFCTKSVKIIFRDNFLEFNPYSKITRHIFTRLKRLEKQLLTSKQFLTEDAINKGKLLGAIEDLNGVLKVIEKALS